MAGFTKLFSCITTSSIWNEDDKVRIVWITMLALAEADGVVRASVGGLAHASRVSREDCERAIARLNSPDDDSRSEEFDGRRIEKVDGGFLLLNFGKYRNARSETERAEYMREYMRNRRAVNSKQRKQKLTSVNRSQPQLAQAEAEAEAEKERAHARPTLAEARSAGPQAGITEQQAEDWWHAREASDWMKGTAGGGSLPVGANWRSDMKSFTNTKLERERSNGINRTNHRSDPANKPGRYA